MNKIRNAKEFPLIHILVQSLEQIAAIETEITLSVRLLIVFTCIGKAAVQSYFMSFLKFPDNFGGQKYPLQEGSAKFNLTVFVVSLPCANLYSLTALRAVVSRELERGVYCTGL